MLVIRIVIIGLDPGIYTTPQSRDYRGKPDNDIHIQDFYDRNFTASSEYNRITRSY